MRKLLLALAVLGCGKKSEPPRPPEPILWQTAIEDENGVPHRVTVPLEKQIYVPEAGGMGGMTGARMYRPVAPPGHSMRVQPDK